MAQAKSKSAVRYNRRELNWLLDGLSIEKAQAHKEVRVEKVV